MSYQLQWGSKHPGLLVYLVDLSGSMEWDGKIDRVSNAVWNVVDGLVSCCQNMGVYKERFHLEVIGYNQYTYNIFSGGVKMMNDKLDLTMSDSRFFNIKKEGKAQGLTHMAMAYDKAAEIVRNWISSRKSNGIPVPAPIVLNITDGFPEESGISAEEARQKALRSAKALMDISVPDGNLLLFNIHIDDDTDGKQEELIFPSSRPSDSGRGFLFDASSKMNDTFADRARRAGLQATANSRFMVSNINDHKLLTRIVTFGSSVSGMTRADGRCEVPIP